MAYSRKYKGKYVIDTEEPVGICDRTKFIFNHKDLVKQMKWSGNSKVWTGLLVGKPFVDDLNDQNRPPMIKKDLEIIPNPRPPKPSIPIPPYQELEDILNHHKWGN